MSSDKAVGFSAAGVSPSRSVTSLQTAPLQSHGTSAGTSPRRVAGKRHSIPHRIGFALASTGAKMAVVPALGSALRRLSIRRRDAPRNTRNVAIQTSPLEADPLQSAATLNSFLRAQRRGRPAVCCPLSTALRKNVGDAPLASAESLFDSELPVARRMVRISCYLLCHLLFHALNRSCFSTLGASNSRTTSLVFRR